MLQLSQLVKRVIRGTCGVEVERGLYTGPAPWVGPVLGPLALFAVAAIAGDFSPEVIY